MIDRELTNYAKSFTHIVPLTGSAGLLLLLQKASSADSIPAFQNSLRIARGTIHFEAIFGNTNISQCDSLMKLLAVAPASKKDILNRLRHKSHYIERMNQLITVLHALDLPDCKMTPSAILALLKEAAALIERVGMSLEASCFVLRQPNTEVKRKVLSVFLTLLLKQQQLFNAVFHNPTVLRLLPVLLSAALSAMNEGNGAQRVNERLGDESSLLWLTLANGSDCLKEKWNDSLSAYFVLLSIARIANAHSCYPTTQFLLFFSVQYFKPAVFLAQDTAFLQACLQAFAAALNRDSRLLQPLAPSRREFACLSPFTRRILQQAFFYSFFIPLHDYINKTVRQEVDNILRKRVFVNDYEVPPSTCETSVTQEVMLTTAEMMVKIPPFSVMGVMIDVVVRVWT